jgi:N-acetylglucosaminyldiphosphoundecaprenol N-acetyl-beta-D-mannosaminyltransferase
VKENFLYNYKEILKKVNFTMGVGGSFDVISGNIKRAPLLDATKRIRMVL